MKQVHFYNRLVLLFLLLVVAWSACKVEQRSLDNLVVRISDDPDRLHPIIARSSISYQILGNVFQSLADYDRQTLQMVPVLLDSIPELIEADTGIYAGFYISDMTIHPKATWSDGSPVLASDVIFTMKSVLICEWFASGIPGLLSSLVNIEPGIHNRQFRVIFKDDSQSYFNGFLLFPVMPAHHYDPESLLDDLDLGDAIENGNPGWLQKQEKWNEFAVKFNSTAYAMENIMGSGPYMFEDWNTGQLIRLIKYPAYWGVSLQEERPILAAEPERISYRIIPEELTAVEALLDGTIDILGDFSPDQFIRLQTIQDSSGTVKTFSPDVLQYFYTSINNRDPKLSDARVRKALAHLLPTEVIINDLFSGLASPIAGPVHPVKPYYNQDLKPVPQDIDRAIELLKDAGWVDSDSNGILDKEIDGQKYELSLRLSTSQRKLGQDISLIFQESAAKAGVQIEIITLDNATLVQEVTERKYTLANLASRFEPGLDELKSTWHSSSAGGVGNNISGFANEEVDKIIDSIQNVKMSEDELFKLYKRFQEKIHEEQPILFICAPKERIAVRTAIDIPVTVLKPGYVERMAKSVN
jgi:peptide/nickel transport system substrate-binding protein